MKNLLGTALFVLFAVVSVSTTAQNVGINTTGATPSNNAILDLNTGNNKDMGLIVPRVVLSASLNTFSPPIAHAVTGKDSGMLVFNYNAANQPIGFYYWNGSAWVSTSTSTTVYSTTNIQDNTSSSGTVTSNGSQILNLTGSASSLTLVPPANPVNGQLWEVTTNQNNISITWSGAFVTTPNNVKKGSSASFFYDASISEWVNM